MAEKIRLAITGATGSVGGAVLDICARFPEIFEITALAARRDAKKLAELGRRHGAKILCLTEPDGPAWREEGFVCMTGEAALTEIVLDARVDHAVFASSGITAIKALQAALERGIDVSLANKESIVVGGPWVMPLVKRRGQLRPIDSEHSAVWQCLRDTENAEVSRVWLTASGGPFRSCTAEQMEKVTAAEALNHPVTLMNKGIECIEAMQLFGLPAEKVGALVHPKSQIHGVVEFIDGTAKLLLSQADMRLPAAAAIAWPRRLPLEAKGFAPVASRRRRDSVAAQASARGEGLRACRAARLGFEFQRNRRKPLPVLRARARGGTQRRSIPGAARRRGRERRRTFPERRNFISRHSAPHIVGA